MNELDDQSDTDNSTMEENTNEDANSYKAKNLDYIYFLFTIFILHSRESDVSLCFGR